MNFLEKWSNQILIRKFRMMNLPEGNDIENICSDTIVLFDTTIGTNNVGDCIIREYAEMHLRKIFRRKKVKRIPTHNAPPINKMSRIQRKYLKIVVGTNILYNKMECAAGQWMFPIIGLPRYKNVCLLAVGWADYQTDTVSEATKRFYQYMLKSRFLHSVRDSYTEKKLKEIGIHNVINTSCVTLWNVDEELCAKIPCKKAKNVITTLNYWNCDKVNDRKMLEILKKNYDNVYVWLQSGIDDEKYLEEISNKKDFYLVGGTVEEYTAILRSDLDLDYVGIRLHAGIKAINEKRRSIIIAIDNRAAEIAKDTNLPICFRKDIYKKLENMISQPFETKIELPLQNIEKWKKQFESFR